jgi:hypothetical protein
MMPACRIPPPSNFRKRLALLMKALSPHRTDPTGAHKPLLRQKVIESAGATSLLAGKPKTTAALKILAPSRCKSNPCLRAKAATLSVYSRLSGMPPQKFCVFSMITNLEVGS